VCVSSCCARGKRLAEPAQARSSRAGLPRSFYLPPVVEVAQALVGCVVRHGECAGVIVETEAYHESEPASHAYVGLTDRSELLFGPPGVAYVYRSYGIHALFNVVCEPAGVGAGVLFRALEPIRGIELMRARRGGLPDRQLCSGPGKLTQALGIELSDNGSDLRTGPIVISARTAQWRDVQLIADRRIGITKAPELPWRFTAAGSRWVSRRPDATAVPVG
jgi:DNA-3-methyladenine glycosylase